MEEEQGAWRKDLSLCCFVNQKHHVSCLVITPGQRFSNFFPCFMSQSQLPKRMYHSHYLLLDFN